MTDELGTRSFSEGDYPEADKTVVLLEKLAIDRYEDTDDGELPSLYDGGEGMGYIGYSESMSLLTERFPETGIKSVSFSSREDLPCLYVDAVAVNSRVRGARYEKCVKLANIIAQAEVLAEHSAYGGRPKYLLPARKTPYGILEKDYPMYGRLEEIASNENNTVILAPELNE